MLSSHLDRCAACQSYELEIRAFTDALRSAPLEPLGRAITVQRPRLSLARMRGQTVAAAVAVAALLGVSQLAPLGTPQPQPVRHPTRAHIAQLPTPQQFEREQTELALAKVWPPDQLQGGKVL